MTSGVLVDGSTINYDEMGNITGLTRNPMGSSSYAYIGNRLTGISGAVTSSYGYDANGNQTSDSGKGITLAYNYLNLPRTISKASTSETMTNSWLVTGAKISKTASGTTRDYAGGIEYSNGVIDFVQTEEGRAIPIGSNGYSYEYMLKDHLGNTRVLLKEDGSVLETSDYYPFGLQVSRSSQTVPSPENRYKYNGKELQTELGLGQYDYEARFYDPVIGRWNVVDPLADADKNIGYSPYSYAINNPISYIDPDGRCWQKAGDSYIPCDDASAGSTTTEAFGHSWTMSKSNGWQLTNGADASTVNYQYDHIEPTGDASYYVDRYKNHIEKYNTRPPNYYLGYGHKYINRFKNETRSDLTSLGKEWLDETAVALQQMMNQGNQQIVLNPNTRGLQGDNTAFQKFAYGTHVPAYSGSGKIGLLKVTIYGI